MKLFKTFTDADFGIDTPFPVDGRHRSAARAIVFDGDGNIALLHATKINYHKLPGGGVEEGEDVATALARELLEEIGCEVSSVRELGIVEEYRSECGLHQISYCYIADLVGEKGQSTFTEKEIDEGFEPVWMSLPAAIVALEAEDARATHYGARFMVARELTFLREALRVISAQ